MRIFTLHNSTPRGPISFLRNKINSEEVHMKNQNNSLLCSQNKLNKIYSWLFMVIGLVNLFVFCWMILSSFRLSLLVDFYAWSFYFPHFDYLIFCLFLKWKHLTSALTTRLATTIDLILYFTYQSKGFNCLKYFITCDWKIRDFDTFILKNSFLPKSALATINENYIKTKRKLKS